MENTVKPAALSEGIEEKTTNNLLFNNLADELLIRTFKYVCDSKKISLVCKRWRELKKSLKFMQKLILVINPYNIDNLYDIIQQNNEFSQRLAYDNVALRDLELSDKLQVILKFLGPKIHNLCLHESLVFDILNDCLPELEEITLRHIPYIASEELKSFDLNKFKCLKSLDINCRNVNTAIKNYMILNPTTEVTFKIEKLCINVSAGLQENLVNCLQFHSQSLKKLEIYCGQDMPIDDFPWTQVFALLEHLEVLKVNGIISAAWVEDIINALPSKAPLQYLSFDTVRFFDWAKILTPKWPTLLTKIGLYVISPIFDENIHQFTHLWSSIRRLTIMSANDLISRSLMPVIPFDMTKLHEMIKNFTNLTHLSIEMDIANVNDNTLSLIFGHLLQLEHLNIKQCDNITDPGLLGSGCNPASITNLKCLQSLKLRHFICMSDLPLIECFKFNELRTLELSNCYDISSNGIKEMVKNCPALEDLTLTHSDGVNDDCILHIAQGLPKLKRLDISGCSRLTNLSLQHILNYCKSLKELTAKKININDREEWEEILKKKMYYYA